MSSDIFDNYAKIMVEKGIVKNAQEDKKEEPKYRNVDLEAVQLLYSVKPNGEDEKHIMEQAHPESVVVSPSYDPLQGLVENEIERQNVSAYIALKPNDGTLTNRRYVKAHDELLNEILKSAFLLDKKNEPELMNLADSCAKRLTTNFNKVAWTIGDVAAAVGIPVGAVAAGGIAGTLFMSGPIGWGVGAGVLAITALVNNFGAVDQGVVANASSAVEELNDLLKDPDEIPASVARLVPNMVNKINSIKQLGQKAINMAVPQSEEELSAAKETLRQYLLEANNLAQNIANWVLILGNVPESEEGMSAVPAILYKVWKHIWTPDVKDAINALNTLRESLIESTSAMSSLYNSTFEFVEQNKERIAESIQESTNQESTKTPQTKEKQVSPTNDLDALTQQLMK